MLDQPSTQNRAESGGDGGETGPGPDRFATRFLVKRCAYDRETSRHLERSANSLDTAPGDQGPDTGGETTTNGGSRENCNARQEHCATADGIAQCAAHQNQSGEKQAVGFD